MAIPEGWESLGLNDPTRYQARFPNQKRTGISRTGTLAVVTDRSTGNYDVYNENILGRTLIYSYNRSNNKENISNENLYNAFFGNDDQKEQKRILDRSIKLSTLEISKDAAIGPTSRREYETIAGSDGYKSLGNNTAPAQTTPIPQTNQSGTQPVNPGGSTDPNEENIGEDIKPKESFKSVDLEEQKKGKSLNYKTADGKTLFQYPLRSNVADFGYDFMKFQAVRYVPAGLSFSDNKLTGSSDIETRIGRESLVTTILPMLPGISESNSISWGGDKANPLQLIAGKLAMGLIESGGSLDFGGVNDAFQATGTEITKALEDDNTAAAIVGYFAGQAVGANVFTRATGIVVNPNLELLFNGPTLRTFNYNFKLTPRDENEAKEVRNIIKSFKQNSLPQRSESNLFLLTPNVYRLTYIYGGDSENQKEIPHPFLNKIKPCALTSFNVNYAPEGSYMTFRGLPSMTCYEINMQFSEIQPIYADEIDMSKDTMSY